jgi:hypothetical protein
MPNWDEPVSASCWDTLLPHTTDDARDHLERLLISGQVARTATHDFLASSDQAYRLRTNRRYSPAPGSEKKGVRTDMQKV